MFTVVVIGTRPLKSLMPLKTTQQKYITVNGYEDFTLRLKHYFTIALRKVFFSIQGGTVHAGRCEAK